MRCGISKLKLHLQSYMKPTNLLLDVLSEWVCSAMILNSVKAIQSSCFLVHSKLACNFQRHKESICELHYKRPACRFSFIYEYN